MIAEAMAAIIVDKGTFWEYARVLVASKAVGQWAVLVAFGFFGICANYLYKWLTEQIGGSLWAYLFRDYPRRTMLAFTVYLGWAVMVISTGLIHDQSTWGAIINLGLSNGFMIDALVNKARRSQWTEDKRNGKVTHA